MYADIEAALVERLRVKFPEIPVFTEAEIERVPELRQKAPAIVVIYNGYTVAKEVPGAFRVVSIRQDFLIVATAKSANTRGGTEEARSQVAEQAQRILGAVIGFEARRGAYFRLADAPGPEYDGGYSYLPLAFYIETSHKADPE